MVSETLHVQWQYAIVLKSFLFACYDIACLPSEFPVISRECGVPVVVSMVGEEVQLSCRGTGTGSIRRIWRRNDMVLSSGEGISISRDSLTILQAEVADSGLYNCTISNMLGSDSINIQLIVQSK